MASCVKCAAPLVAPARFCAACGSPVRSPTPAPSPAPLAGAAAAMPAVPAPDPFARTVMGDPCTPSAATAAAAADAHGQPASRTDGRHRQPAARARRPIACASPPPAHPVSPMASSVMNSRRLRTTAGERAHPLERRSAVARADARALLARPHAVNPSRPARWCSSLGQRPALPGHGAAGRRRSTSWSRSPTACSSGSTCGTSSSAVSCKSSHGCRPRCARSWRSSSRSTGCSASASSRSTAGTCAWRCRSARSSSAIRCGAPIHGGVISALADTAGGCRRLERARRAAGARVDHRHAHRLPAARPAGDARGRGATWCAPAAAWASPTSASSTRARPPRSIATGKGVYNVVIPKQATDAVGVTLSSAPRAAAPSPARPCASRGSR